MLQHQFEKLCMLSGFLYSRCSKDKLVAQIGAAVDVGKTESVTAAQEEEAWRNKMTLQKRQLILKQKLGTRAETISSTQMSLQLDREVTKLLR